MNRNAEFEAMLEELNRLAPGLETTLDRAHRRWRRTIKVWIAVSVAICVVLCIVPLWNSQPSDIPLVIKAYAIDMDGQSYTVNLSLGERIQLSSATFHFEGNYEYCAFDLSLMDGLYLQLSAVDENWELILDKRIHVMNEVVSPPYWALTEGTDIAVISTDLEGNVFQEYIDGSKEPRMKGSSLIWRVNNDDMNRCIIDCFDENFSRIVSYYLEISENNGIYFAEIVKME